MDIAVAAKEIRVLRFAFCLVALLSCSAVNASLIRYDVSFDSTSLGHLVFDAEFGVAEQNLWGSLVDWNLSWSGVEFTSANSTAALDSLFVVDEAGVVIKDSELIIDFVPCGFRFCASTELTQYPLFSGATDTSLGFGNGTEPLFDSYGALLFDDGTGEQTLVSSPVTYSGPTAVATAVPAPSAAWLFATAIIVLGVFRRKIAV